MEWLNLVEELDLMNKLNNKKNIIDFEVQTQVPGMRAFIKIIPVEQENLTKYKTNLMPVIAYEVRFMIHMEYYTNTTYGLDYDYVLDNKTTRIKRIFVERQNDNAALLKTLNAFTVISPSDLDSALVHSPIEGYLENRNAYPHLWLADVPGLDV